MRGRFYHFITILFLVLSTISCTEIVDIKLDSTYARLAVFGTITTDSIKHEIVLTRTTDYFYNQPPPPVRNATVSISFGDTIIYLPEDQNIPGVYRMTDAFRGNTEVSYTLEISDVDINDDGLFENYESSTLMPTIEKADSLQLVKFITPFFSGFQVALWSPEPSGSNWYNYKLIKNGESINKRLSDYSVQPDEFINGNYIAGLPVGFLNDDDDDENVIPGDTITLEINSISKAYYNFIVDAQSEIFGNNPLFSGPPANVPTNISNGAVGIFTAYSIDRISIIAASPEF